MTSAERILVATDLAPASDLAMRAAVARAPAPRGRVAVFHVCDDGAGGAARVRAHLRDVIAAPDADALDVIVRDGDPAEQIAAVAEQWHADLVVLGEPVHASGVLGRLFRPRVVEQVLRHAPCRVLVTREEPGSGVILVGVDVDERSPVLGAAARELALRGGEAVIAHWISPVGIALPAVGDAAIPITPWENLAASALPALEQAAHDAKLTGDVRVVAGDPGNGLCELAAQLHADLVVVGTHSRRGIARIALGSVAEHVANHAPCSVLVVRIE